MSTIAHLSPVTKSIVSNTPAMTSIPGVPVRGEEVAGPSSAENHSPFSFRAPMDNIVIRTFQFPTRYLWRGGCGWLAQCSSNAVDLVTSM